MAEEIYLFLNSDTKAFSENTPAKFTTVFNTPVELSSNVENFEVGVSKLIVSSHALNVVDGEFSYHSVALGSNVASRIPKGQYDIPNGFLTAFTTSITPDSANYIMSYDLPARKFRLQTKSDACMITFSENLQKLTGFGPIITGAGVTYGTQSWDISGGFGDLYVFCNNVELSYLASAKLPIMAVFPYRASSNVPDQLLYEPSNIIYVPLLRKTFQSIEIVIKNDSGQLFTFPEGSQSVIVLHVRPGRL